MEIAQVGLPPSFSDENETMSIIGLLAVTVTVKLVISFAIYLKARHAFAGLSLPAKGAVIGGGWLASYGIFQFLEGII